MINYAPIKHPNTHTCSYHARPKRHGSNMIIIKKRFSVGVSMDFIAKQYAIEREKKISSIVYRAGYLKRLCWRKKYRLMIESCYKRAESDVCVCVCVWCSFVLYPLLFADDDFKIYTFETLGLLFFIWENNGNPQLKIQSVQWRLNQCHGIHSIYSWPIVTKWFNSIDYLPACLHVCFAQLDTLFMILYSTYYSINGQCENEISTWMARVCISAISRSISFVAVDFWKNVSKEVNEIPWNLTC